VTSQPFKNLHFKILLILCGGLVFTSFQRPIAASAFVSLVLAIIAVSISLFFSTVRRTAYEKSVNSPMYCLKDKVENLCFLLGLGFAVVSLFFFAWDGGMILGYMIATIIVLFATLLANLINKQRA